MHVRVLAVAAMFAAPAQSAILYQQTLGPGSGTVWFDDYLPTTPSMVWIGVTGGTIVNADWRFQAEYEKWWWELISEDDQGNQDIYLNGNNYEYITGCSTSPGAPTCTSGFGFKSQMQHNTVRIGYTPPQSYNNCFPFDGQFDVDCAYFYQPAYGAFTVEVSGTEPMTLTISDTHIAGAVPEPGSWALLIAGFGLTGAALRRRARSPASG